MWADKAIQLIQQHGIFGLGGYDGCLCTNFEIQGIYVSVSCHKSEHCVRVWSNYMFRNPLPLESVMKEVLASLEKTRDYPVDDYRIRFYDYKNDHDPKRRGWEGPKGKEVWVDYYIYCYCGKDRKEREAYLCEIGRASCREG